jgi:LDH2 family malate/lactate/ureidoglycolate dehydrogenase
MTTQRYKANDLIELTSQLFTAMGLPLDRSRTVAEVFVEADLMGFSTHGINRVPSNLEWLQKGATQTTAEPEVLVDRGAIVSWDANQLPGPYIVSRGVELACERARQFGQSTVIMRRAQHIACLAAYLGKAIDQGLVIQMICSTPGDRCVSAFGGSEPLFSPNPFAFAAPTGTEPILIDMSLSIVAEGYVAKAQREGWLMGSECLKNNKGEPSNNPADYWDQPRGSIMPVGGLDHGYKGYGLCLWSELMTMALGNFGRADSPPFSEENSVIIQVFDPEVFGSLSMFEKEASHLAEQCRQSRVREGDPEVRVPGDRALSLRKKQLAEGVEIDDRIIAEIIPLAAKLGVPMVSPL